MLYLNVKFGFFPSDVKAFLYFKFEKRFVGIDNFKEALVLQLEFFVNA